MRTPNQSKQGGLVIKLEGKPEAVAARLKTLEQTDRFRGAVSIRRPGHKTLAYAEVH